MAEKPILFSTPMVRAILNTKPDTWPPEPIDPSKPYKYMTRRVIKPRSVSLANAEAIDYVGNGEFVPVRNNRHGPFAFKCPYQPGTVLWVREKFQVYDIVYDHYMGGYEVGYPLAKIPKEQNKVYVEYAADGDDGPWRPSIHMPRWAARLFLLVKDVRVERLQDITEEDAIAEGVQRDGDGWKSYDIIKSGPHKGKGHPWNVFPYKSAILSFQSLWDSINGKKYIIHEWEDDDGVIHKEKIEASYSWESNPQVWVVSFMRTERPVTP